MRNFIAALFAVSFLYTTGCTQTPPAPAPAPPPKAPAATPAAGTPAAGTPAAASPSTVAASPGGASPSAAASSGSSPAADAATGGAADRLAEMQTQTGIAFDPSGFQPEKASGGDVQLLKAPEVMITLNVSDEDPKASTATGMEVLKMVGKDTFKVTKEPTDNEEDGLKGTVAMGTTDLQPGTTVDWFVGAVTAGKKTLRITALGADLKKSNNFGTFMKSIKPKK